MPIQPPVFLIDLSKLVPTSRRRHYQVWWRRNWADAWSDQIATDDGSFAATKYLQAPTVHVAASGSGMLSSAELVWRVGTIKREDETAFVRRTWARLRGTFIKIVLLPMSPLSGQFSVVDGDSASGFNQPGGGNQGDETVIFVGYVPEARGSAVRDFSAQSSDQSADQTPTAYGLEFLLDRNVIGESWVRKKAYQRVETSELGMVFVPDDANDTAMLVKTAITFNDSDRVGLSLAEHLDGDAASEKQKQGNRTFMPLVMSDDQDDDEDVPTIHLFDGGQKTTLPDDTAVPGARRWSVYDIAEYLLAAHAPRTVRDGDGNPIPSALNGLQWRLAIGRPETWPGEVAEETPDGIPATPGGDDSPALRMYRALCGWKPASVETEGRTIKQVFDSLFNAARGLGWRVRLVTDSDDEDWLEVEIFSIVERAMKFGDELELPASSRQVEFIIDSPTALRSLDVRNDVLTKYGKIIVQGERILSCFTIGVVNGVLVEGWTVADEEAYIEAAGSADDAELNDAVRQGDKFRHVFTTFRVAPDWDGTVQRINTLTGTPVGSIDPLGTWRVNPVCNADGTLAKYVSTPRGIRNWGLQFEDFLPIKSAETATEFDRELRRPLVLIKDPADKWVMVEKDRGPGASVRMLDKALGIEVNARPNHLITLLEDGAPSFAERPTEVQPQFDYRTLLATVAMRLDDRLLVEETIAGGDPSLTLRITVDGAECWYVVSGTIIDPHVSGILLATGGGEVRNDRRRLQQVLTLCRAWYGTFRQRMTVSLNSVEPGYEVGDVITNLVEVRTGGRRYATVLNTPITSKVIDLEHQTTTWRTDFAELDFAVAGGS